MERKKFIKSSGLFLGSLSIFPMVAKTLEPTRDDGDYLLENQHIRHGNYGGDFRANDVSGQVLKSVRIDRFLNPSGNMLLMDCTTNYGGLRISITSKSLIYEFNDNLIEIEHLNESQKEVILSEKIILLSNPTEHYISDYNIKEALIITDFNKGSRLISGIKQLQKLKGKQDLICLFT